MTAIETVLLVDDDLITNMLHEQLIRKSGRVANVLVANDGKAALDILEGLIAEGKPVPELIFLDINMPGMGGFEFLEEYGQRDLVRQAQLIIVMLSTSLLAKDHARAQADPNVHSFANKPMDADKLNELIDEYLEMVAGQS